MNSDSRYFQTSDGAQLFARHWSASERVRAVIHLTHGLAEHSARYESFAEALTNRGFHVYAHDQRGHGQSILPGETPGHFADDNGWSLLVSDLSQLVAAEKAAHPELPFIVFGHSMGTLVTRRFLCDHSQQVAAAILSGSNGNVSPLVRVGRLIARIERWRLGKRGQSRLINSLSFDSFNNQFKPNRTAFDWLTRDTNEVDKYVTDPLCGFIASTQSWMELLGGIVELANAEQQRRIRSDLPLYVFTGALDPVTENAKGSEKLVADYRNRGLQNITFKSYPNARHETLNELNRDEVVNDLLEWIEQRINR